MIHLIALPFGWTGRVLARDIESNVNIGLRKAFIGGKQLSFL